MASMRKKGKGGHWYARFYDRRRTPARKEVPLRTTRKDVARRRLVEMERAYEAGDLDPWAPHAGPGRLSLKEATEQFMQSRQHLRPKTIRAYGIAMRGLLEVAPAGLMLRDVRAEHVRPYVLASGVSASTQRHRHRHLKALFNWCRKHDLIDHDPCEKVRTPKRKKKVAEFLTPRQLEQLLAAIEWDYEQKRAKNQIRPGHVIWLKDVILLAVGTGMRLGEVTHLRWRDIDFESGFLRVRSDDERSTKSGHERRIPLAGDALDVLMRLEAARPDDLDGYVFTGFTGGKLNDHYVSKQFRTYRRLAKLPESISFHSLRHTCASWLVQRGVPLSIVQHILGHSDIQVTQRYAHLAPDVMKAAMQQAFGA